MKKIISDRCTGKTYQLIQLAAKSGDTIVSMNKDSCDNIKYEAEKLGLAIPPPITFRQFINKEHLDKEIKGFLIDDLDICLQKLTNIPINCITLSL